MSLIAGVLAGNVRSSVGRHEALGERVGIEQLPGQPVLGGLGAGNHHGLLVSEDRVWRLLRSGLLPGS
jgi:hypothetical protein